MGVGYNRHLNHSKRVALRSVINTLPEKMDKHLVPHYTSTRLAEENRFLPFEMHMMRHDSDKHYSGSELMSRERSLESELRHIRTRRAQSYNSSDDKYRLNHKQNFVSIPILEKSEQRNREHTSHQGSMKDFAVNPIRSDEFSSNGLPIELGLDDSGGRVTRSMELWNCPPSPIFQVPLTPIQDNFSDLSVFSNPMTTRTIPDLSLEDPRIGIDDLLPELNYDESMDGSFLYVTTDDVEKLERTLRERGLAVQDIGKTKTPGILAVVFRTHEVAKRAFTTQQDFGIRMEPPKITKRNWYRNPTPKFHVKFETTRRLTVKTGKSISKVKVGDFLMSDARMDKGCIIWADQLKGHRLRVVGFVGRFMNTEGHILEQNDPPLMEDRRVIGWISTQCNKTKKKFVLRKSGNNIKDYVYINGMEAVE